MPRVLDKTAHVSRLPRKTPEPIALMADDLDWRWQDRVGDEIEQTGSYSSEEYYFARLSALEHGGLDGET